MQKTTLSSLTFLFLQLFCLLPGFGQYYQQNYFRNPINEDISLAGSFGELRPNHFHTGIDIKTCGDVGLPVYAAADGFVRRIGVSGTGYGNVLYLDHPNGFTTVYGHMLRFAFPIQQYVRNTQYKTESFEQDIVLDSILFKVKKGDLIGFSGNSGGSKGAHLHFEIRETKTERPVNPLLWGFRIPDNIPPVMQAIKIYPLDTGSYITVHYVGKRGGIRTAFYGQSIKIPVFKSNGQYYLRSVAKLEGMGKLGFSIEGFDYQNGSYNHVGVYHIELCVNEEAHYMKQMRMLDFDMKRYINTHTDYAEHLKSGIYFEKSFVTEHNVLPIYDVLVDKGAISLQPGVNKLSYYMVDIESNISVLPFEVHCSGTVLPRPAEKKNYDTIFPIDKDVVFSRPDFSMKIPANTFYEDIPFFYRITPRSAHYYSSVYELGSPAYPANDYFDLAIKTTNLPEKLQEKACILSAMTGYLGGHYENGWIRTRARSLGKFFVATDVSPPMIKPVNIRYGMNMSRAVNIRFIIKDDMSGIATYKGKIDGHYVLFQRDIKNALIYYEFDEYCPPGPHTLQLTVTDNRNNSSVVEYHFSR